jgi:hypothetical protein
MREALAHALNMHPRTVQIWFQNQRQKAKNNPQLTTNQSVAGVVPHQLDSYHSSASDFVLPVSPPRSTNGGDNMLFSSMTMLSNNSSAGVNGSMAQAISASVTQHNLLPGSPYALMPFYQGTPANAATSSTSSYSPTFYLPSATLGLSGYHPTPASAYPPTPTSVSQVSPQQGYPSPTATSPTDEFSNPTLDMLAAAALEAEGDSDNDDDGDDDSTQQHHIYDAKCAEVHHAPGAMCSPDQLRPW